MNDGYTVPGVPVGGGAVQGGYGYPEGYGAAGVIPGGLAGNGLAGGGLAGGGYDDPSIGGYGAPDFAERGQALARSRGSGRSGRSGRSGGTLAVSPPPAFALTPGGGLAMSPWVALGLVAAAVALGVWVERRYKLTARAEAKVRDEVEDTKRKYKVTKRAIKQTARASRKRLADRIYRSVAGDDESEDEGGR